MGKAEHRPAQGQSLDHGAAEGFRLRAQLQHQGGDRHDFTHVGSRRSHGHALGDAQCRSHGFEFSQVVFTARLTHAKQEQARIHAACLEIGNQLQGKGMALKARATRRQGQQRSPIEHREFGEEAATPFVFRLVTERKLPGIHTPWNQDQL